MKTSKYLWISLLTISMVACENKGKSDKSEIIMKPVETEVSGDMEGCFKVVDKEYKATGDWGDGIITVEIERTDEDLPFEIDGKTILSFGEYVASEHIQVGFGIEFLDEDGNVLEKVSANGSGFSGSYDHDEAKSLVKLKPGKKGTIRFVAVKGAVGFRISSAYEDRTTSSASKVIDLTGTVSKYPIVMHLKIDGKNVAGHYYYSSSGPNSPLKLSGNIDKDGKFDIHETNDEGQPTGHFTGFWNGNVFSGDFVNYKGQHFDFTLTKQSRSYAAEIDNDEVYDNDVSISDDYAHHQSINIGEMDMSGENWDEFLDAYERYVDKLIPYLRKATNGDISALADYPNMMIEAEKFSNKIQNANTSGLMTSSQWQRYMKIQEKILKETERMQNQVEKMYNY
ncbi:MAG: hypothetical protein IKI09_06880 [Bacteroidales bacterium]|nr:hypothetical protein [Bacteroidales bacterium]